MVELNMRDLVVLRVITQWNKEQAEKLKYKPRSAQPSLAQPCTITTLCGKMEPQGGLVNACIKLYKLNIELADDSEQVYRSTKKLAEAGLIYPVNSKRQQYAQTEKGEAILQNLSPVPNLWPSTVKIDGNNITIPALIGG